MRAVAVVLIACIASISGLATAGAAERGFPALRLPSLGAIAAWFQDPHWGRLPHQQSGTAAGHGHYVPAADTRSGSGVGRKPGKGRGELAGYAPYRQAAEQGLSAVRGTGFNARTSKRIAAKSDRLSTYFQNTDGTVTRRVAMAPVNYQDAHGGWQPISTKVTRGADGRWHEAANSLSVDFAAQGSAGTLGSFAVDSAHGLSYALQGAKPVTGTASGSTVTYASVLPDTDLELAPIPTGVKEAIVLHSAAAANSWTFPLTLHGLTAKPGKDGGVDLVDSSGKAVEEIPAAYAYDSKVDPRSGDPATTHAVSYQLVQAGGKPALKVTLDPTWLHSADRTFPVTVDPTLTDGWTTTYAESSNGGDHSTEQTIKVGSYDAGTHKANSFINHWFTSIDGSKVTVTAASLTLYDTWASICTAERFDVAPVTQAWTPTGVTAYPGPTYGASIGNLTPSVPDACANSAANRAVGDWVTVPLSTTTFQGWANGTTADYGLALYADTTDNLHWKQFGSFNDPGYQPYLSLTYTGNVAPQIYQQYPANNAAADTTTPELDALGRDDGSPNSSLQYDFTVYNASGASVADSGLVSAGSWTVPAGKLSWGQTYYWSVRAYDGALYSAATPWEALTVQVKQPLITSGLSQNSSEHGFDASIGNYTTSDTDASVSTVGPSLDVVRDYNSRDPRWTGAFGAGWSSVFDSRATEQYNAAGTVTGVVVTYPDGSEVGFGKNSDGSFSPPSGRWATFKSVTGGYTLTDKNDTVYAFTQSLGSGGYGISSVTDADGRAVTYTWTSGEITAMTSAVSGRALHVTWSTPTGAAAPHVATVFTDPVSGTDQNTDETWKYTYNGDQLSSVCAPLDYAHCTSYGYTSGSQYQTASLDLAPHSLWPFAESSGSTAASAVTANEGTDNATYSNVTLGQAGPLTGSSATAAGFNGSSSYVQLPNSLANATNSESLSMWFKTSAGPGVLFSYQSQPLDMTSLGGYYTPSLYVGTDGKLNAEFWYASGVQPITTSGSVADGKWHHVVLSGAGDTQTLYLDGAAVGSAAGQISAAHNVYSVDQGYTYIGAGYLGGYWPDEPHYSTTSNTGYPTYFNGSIADVGFYTKPLVSADVKALYNAGSHAASLLSTVTRPSGKAYASIAYNAVNGAVTQVTDENGGVWKLAAPTVTGSSQTYRGAVLGSAPLGYWRLGDAAGSTTAADEVHGGTGTYNAVTLGASGPFSDRTGASFDGSSSYLQLPSNVNVTTGPDSVEMWFKMPKGNTAGGVLFDQEKCAVTASPVACGGYNPALYVGTDGKLYGKFWDSNYTSNQIVTSGTVNDGLWHHVVLAASGSSQTMYLDGSAVGSTTGTMSATGTGYDYVGAGAAGGNWTNHPTNTLGYFPGSISEVAFYTTQLSAQEVASHFAAGKNSTGLLPVESVAVTDPLGRTETTRYDVDNGYRMLSETDGLGNTTSYGYDTSGFQYTVVDPNGAMTRTGHDVRGNTVSLTSCQNQAASNCSTQYFSYYPDDTTAQLTTADPRNDLVLTERDGRSASATDNTYLTSYGYDALGDRTTETTPAVAGFPNGRTTTTVYSDGTSAYPAADSGNVPIGLPVKTVSPGGAVNTVSYFHDGDVASTTDANGLVTSYGYDGIGRVVSKKVVSDTYPSGLTTSYVYDADGQVTQENDPAITDRVTGAVHTSRISTVYDVDGDVTSQTVADTTGGDAARTETTGYNSYDQVASRTDANANAGASNGNTTTYGYDAMGEQVKEVDQGGQTTETSYDANGHLLTQTLDGYTGDPVNPSSATNLVESSRAYDPAGRLASLTDAMGNTTKYTYTDNGLLATVVRYDATGAKSFTVQSNSYDGAGNLTQRVTNNGATVTQYAVDAASRVTSTTVDPTGVDRTNQVSYTPDDMVATSTEHDSSGWDRTVTDTYDPMGNKLSETLYGDASGHPAGWWKLDQSSGSTVTDASGNGNTASAAGVTWTTAGDGTTSASFTGTGTQQIATNGPVLNTAGSYTVSAWVDLSSLPTHNSTVVSQSGSVASEFYLQYNYAHTGAPLWSFEHVSGDVASPTFTGAYSTGAATTGWTHLVGVYNVSTGAMQLYVNGTLAGTNTDTAPWNATGPLTIGSAKFNSVLGDDVPGLVGNVQAYSRALSASEVSTLYGNGRTGGTVGSSSAQTTKWTYDKRGLPLSETDPNGNTTNYTYDEAGNLVVTTEPAVSVEATGGTANAVTERPVTTSGFNTFGEAVEEVDPNGNQTVTAYDANGDKVSETLPSYTPPGASAPITATTVTTYDADGNVTAVSKPDGETTSYLYDQLGDVAQVTAADGSKTHSVYDANGEELSSTDADGAQSQATYDWMGRQVTTTTLERYPTAQTLTSTNSYAVTTGNPYGAFLASTTSAGGVTTSYGYNRAGDVSSVTDGAGNTTRYSYDFQGNVQKTTLPDGTWSEVDYNAQGLPTYKKQYDASNTLLAQTSTAYDGNGNAVAATDARGHTSTFQYDASNMVVSETQPVDASTSITTSFGYDAAGQRTRYTDGRGNSWTYGYTPWGQLQSTTEPGVSTSQYTYTSAGDSTQTDYYNGDGQLVSQSEPGGVSLSYGYDKVGNLTTESGTGAEAATATRTFSYDSAGQILSAATTEAGTTGNADHQAASSESFSYNDRGQLLSASGSGGSSSFAYTADGNLASRTDAAGTTSYGYDTAGRLASVDDPATGTQLTYAYNTLNQPTSVTYGSSGNVRSYSYDSLHRLTGDTLAKGSTTVSSIAYGYDANSNLTSKTTTGVAGASANTYTYDWANRLTSWNNGTATTAYAYDASGNRIQVGSNVYTYDARDQLTSDGVNTYRYSARGTMTLDLTSSGSTAYAADAFGQQVVAGSQSYALDAMGRNVTDTDGQAGTSRTFQYSGATNTIAADGDYTYTYDPGDALVGVNTAGATSTSTGQLAVTDQHDDVVGTFTPGASTLASSATYDPLGNVTANNTLTGHLGFQSGWTESATGKVGTASRWYNPATGTFLNKDSVSLNPVPNSAAANPFAYIGDNPLSSTDPSGHCWFVCDIVNSISSSVSSAWDSASSWASSTWDDFSSYADNAWDDIRTAARTVYHAAKRAVTTVVHHVRDAYHYVRHYVHRVYHWAARHVRRIYHAAVHAVRSAWHAVKRAAKRVVHAVKRAAKAAVHAVSHAVRTAYHATVSAVKTAAKFVKHHAAAITSFVVSTAAFAGCEALTAGVGTVGCAAIAGAAGNLVTQGFQCAQKGGSACSLSSFGKSAVEGAAEGALGGALGELGGAILGKVAPKALDAVGGLFGKGASEVGEDAAADATDQAVNDAEASGAKSASEEGGGGSCKIPHSFTGATKVLMADGSTKAIDQIKVGDTVTDAVPGQQATQAHKVTAVIVTHTDHDFADVTVKPTGAAAAKATSMPLKTRVLRKAGLGLAAAAAGVGALLGLGHHATGQPAPVAYTTDATTQAAAAGGGTLHTTYHHPFYDRTQSSFVEAQHLHVGDILQSPSGTAQVTQVRLFHANTTTYDLTIGDLHTYYVVAGGTPVLVHNITPGQAFECGPGGEVTDPEFTGVKLNKKIGDTYADMVAEDIPGADREVSHAMANGTTRRTDIEAPLPSGGVKGIEVKVGRVSNVSSIRQEMTNDSTLLADGTHEEQEWEFFRSPLTGKMGPTGSVAWRLLRQGVTLKLHY